MFSLILIVIIGLGIALFSQQNTQTVSVAVGTYSFSAIPVYLIVIASMLVGLVISWVLSVLNFFNTALLLKQKDGAITSEHRRVEKLEQELEDLRVEHARLEGKHRETSIIHKENDERGLLTDVRERLKINKIKGVVS